MKTKQNIINPIQQLILVFKMIIKCLTVEAAGGGDIRNADLVKAFLAA